MNNLFSIDRFGLLLRRQWSGFGKIYLLSLAIVMGIFVAFYAFNLNDFAKTYESVHINSAFNFRTFLFVFLGLIYIVVIASTYFVSLANKSKAPFELLIPASSLEKFLGGIFYTAICSTFAYFFIFCLVDYIFVAYTKFTYASIYNYLDRRQGLTITVDDLTYYWNKGFPSQLYYMLFVPFLLHAVFFLGSLSFKNNHFIKTAVTLILYITLWVLAVVGVSKYFDGNRIMVGQTHYDELDILRMCLAVGIIMTLAIWSIAYLRLKEKEV